MAAACSRNVLAAIAGVRAETCVGLHLKVLAFGVV